MKALITEWAGQLQMRVMRIRPANENDEIDMQDYVKAAPEDPHKMYDYIWEGQKQSPTRILKRYA